VEGTQRLYNKNRNPHPIKNKNRRVTLLMNHIAEDMNKLKENETVRGYVKYRTGSLDWTD